jgi:hypothetical protein
MCGRAIRLRGLRSDLAAKVQAGLTNSISVRLRDNWRQEGISQGLKPDSCSAANVRAEARTYLRNKSNDSEKQVAPASGGRPMLFKTGPSTRTAMMRMVA